MTSTNTGNLSTTSESSLAMEFPLRPAVICAACSGRMSDLKEILVTHPVDGDVTSVRITHRKCDPREPGSLGLDFLGYLIWLLCVSGSGEFDEDEEANATLTLDVPHRYRGGR